MKQDQVAGGSAPLRTLEAVSVCRNCTLMSADLPTMVAAIDRDDSAHPTP